MSIDIASLRYVSAANTTVNAASRRTGEIFDLYYASVYRYLYGCIRDASESEDLAQEVFVRLYQQLRDGKEIANLRPWLFTVAHNLAVNFSKTARRRHVVLSIDEHDSAESSALVAEALSRDALFRDAQTELRTVAAASLESLSDRERRCLELRAEGLCYREIADVLSISISSVTTYLTRAIRKLKEHEDVSDVP